MKTNEIYRSYGTDYKEMTKRLLKQADLIADIPEDAVTIGIKPNLVTPSPASFGATTHPEIIAGIIEYLREHQGDVSLPGKPRMLSNGKTKKAPGAENSGRTFEIIIAEGSWVGDETSEAFTYCGYRSLAEQYGVTLLDTKKDSFEKKALRSKDTSGAPMTLNVCSCVSAFDYLINVPVLKGHCQTKMTCALKNMKGLIPDSEKRRFHSMGLHKPIAALNTCIRQDFIVVDHICGDLDFEEGGNPVERNCIMTAKDPVLLDAFVCHLLGYHTEDVPYVKLAEKLQVGSADLSQLRLCTLEKASGIPEELFSSPDLTGERKTGEKLLAVSYAVDEIDSCSACYGMLIPALTRLKEEGLLEKLSCRIAIGQGHRGSSGKLGIGACTSGFEYSVKGCPPSEEEIYQGLKAFILAR